MQYSCQKCGGPLPADMTKECSVCFPGTTSRRPLEEWEQFAQELSLTVWLTPQSWYCDIAEPGEAKVVYYEEWPSGAPAGMNSRFEFRTADGETWVHDRYSGQRIFDVPARNTFPRAVPAMPAEPAASIQTPPPSPE